MAWSAAVTPTPAPAGRLVLAPMEGVADDILRDVLTRVGGWDWCVTEFIRVAGNQLPHRTYLRVCPELKNRSRTDAGTPVRVQLLGSDPPNLAENAAHLAKLEPVGIDLNFGCPAPTVNRHRGGAALLGEPELLHDIVQAIRAVVPAHIPVTAKMRLGITDESRALDCARALVDGGASELVVHGRTKLDGYKPPAKWHWIRRIREAIPESIPVIANGEVWTVADWHAIRAETGCPDVMIGRGAVADPFLARRIRGERDAAPAPADWDELKPLLARFWRHVLEKVEGRHTAGRMKMWLKPLARTWPEAAALFAEVRTITDPPLVTRALEAAGIVETPEHDRLVAGA